MEFTKAIHPDRVRFLNDRPVRRGRYVLYWMQQSQRAEMNHALEYAVQRANEMKLPPVVVFCLMDDYPEANLRHYRFMIEGLGETRRSLNERGIRFLMRRGSPPQPVLDMSRDAALLVCDRGYLHHQRVWRDVVSQRAPCPVFQVESDVLVPVEVVSQKAEYAARTFRPKFYAHAEEFGYGLDPTTVERDSLTWNREDPSLDNLDAVIAQLHADSNVAPVPSFFQGGTLEAKRRLDAFIKTGLSRYHANRNQPQTNDVSAMSPYLHFGQISPVYIALAVRGHGVPQDENRRSFLEELLVRRELAHNFVYFNPNYASYDGLPEWVRKTLEEHAADSRPYRYSKEDLETARTHDFYWNAAMTEMRETGYLHNSMRMYWGKKILEWVGNPREAFRTALELNNRYFLDGRDPNSYASIGWIFGLHDRPWKERPVFGKVRAMTAKGLERKCDIRAYVRKVAQITGKSGAV